MLEVEEYLYDCLKTHHSSKLFTLGLPYCLGKETQWQSLHVATPCSLMRKHWKIPDTATDGRGGLDFLVGDTYLASID